MGNWRDAFPSKWFSHKDLDKPILVTIKKVTMEDIAGDGGDRKPVVWFNEVEKGLGLNITNGTTIEEIARSGDPDDWPGTMLVLYKTDTYFKGKRVDCVRVRRPKPGTPTPQPQPEPEMIDDDVPF